MPRLAGYLVLVGLFLLPISGVVADSHDKSDSHDRLALYDKSNSHDKPDSHDKLDSYDESDYYIKSDSYDKSESEEMSLMVGLFTKHVDQSDDPNENSQMLAVSYKNYVVSRYVNTWEDPTYFGGKRLQTKKYPYSENNNLFFQGNLYAGFLYGYGNNAAINVGGIAPALLPTVGVGYKSTSLEMGYIPTPSGGVFLSLFKYEF